MADVDIHAPQRSSKIQLEDQQHERRADIRDARWPEVVYPNRFRLNPITSASVFEIAGGIIVLLFSLILVFRMFFVADVNKTRADYVGFIIFYALVGIIGITSACFLFARVVKSMRENKIYVLPNGFPINIETILNDYSGVHDSILSRLGYYEVEHARAGNPVVAPGEITYTYSPSDTYAPSNMPKDKADDTVLQSLLNIEEESDPDEADLPAHVNFFDYIDMRDSGHLLLGVDEQEEPIQIPITAMFNHLVGGAVGSGKSLYLRSLVYQLLIEADESDIPITLGLADIENNTFPEFRGCRNVQWYASNYVEIEHMTGTLLKEVERRKIMYESLSSTPKDIERYNVLARREGHDELPIVVIVYDEFSALMHRSRVQQKRILSDILQLALRSRKYGIFLIIAGQTFKADLIDSAVLGQFNFSTAFKVRSGAASISIIGQTGAERLKHPGEALVKAKDGTIQRMKAFFIDDDELLEALHDLRDPSSEDIIPGAVQEIITYAHEHMGDRLKFRELEIYMGERGVSRSDLLHYLDWMDQHKFTMRGDKNARVLNWARIEEQ